MRDCNSVLVSSLVKLLDDAQIQLQQESLAILEHNGKSNILAAHIPQLAIIPDFFTFVNVY